jgi:hypothetical protein
MAYSLTETKNALSIAEQQYATATKIKFTPFTSCIGVIAKKGDKLTGVHLVAIGDGGVFMPTDVNRVHNLLPTPADRITVFGFIDDWRSGLNGEEIKIATLKLTGELKLNVAHGEVEHYYEVKEDDGTYSAEIVGDGIKLTKEH